MRTTRSPWRPRTWLDRPGLSRPRGRRGTRMLSSRGLRVLLTELLQFGPLLFLALWPRRTHAARAGATLAPEVELLEQRPKGEAFALADAFYAECQVVARFI